MTPSYAEEKHVLHLAKELEQQGYSVIRLPSPENIPFSLEGYTPDLIAEKEGEHVVVEVKRKGESSGPVQKLVRVAEIVEKHPGWKFLVKTVPDSAFVSAPEPPGRHSLPDIEAHLHKAEKIIEAGLSELSVPYLWNAVISLLRLQASHANLSCSELSDSSLINKLYTMGLISLKDYQELKRWHSLRNDAIHSISFKADPVQVKELLEYANSLAEKAKHDAESRI